MKVLKHIKFCPKTFKSFSLIKFYSKMEKNLRWENPLDEIKEGPAYRTKLHLQNSLTNIKQEFVTLDGSRVVNWYICGPTVYDSAHLGHAKTYVGFDILRRIMTSYFGYEVNYTMNITDIDDKIINRSNEKEVEFQEFARRWEEDFFNDMKTLNVMYPSKITRVSEYIPNIVEYIERLVKKEYAYEKEGSVYFDTEFYKKQNVSLNLTLVPIPETHSSQPK